MLFYRRRHPMGRNNVTLFLTFVHMIMTYDDIRYWYGLGACKLCNICFIDYNANAKIKYSGIRYNTDNIQMM